MYGHPLDMRRSDESGWYLPSAPAHIMRCTDELGWYFLSAASYLLLTAACSMFVHGPTSSVTKRNLNCMTS